MNSNNQARCTERGFTLVEIMVVVVIIGMLATVVIQSVFQDQDYAMLQKVKVDIKGIEHAIDRYRLRELKLPDSLEDLITENESGYTYLKSLNTDPWRNEYEYEILGGNKYLIRCNGEDGESDTDDDITSTNMAELRTLPRMDRGG